MRLKALAAQLINAFLLEVYLRGHSGAMMPHWLRRPLARTEIHRAWLYGYNGCFSENGVRYGPANRYRDRHLASADGYP